MKKAIIVLLICFVSNIQLTNAQSNDLNVTFSQTEALPQENIFVHFNTSLFLAGESLYYKVYCLDKETNKLSSLSKIAYVELVNEDLKVTFKHKVKLESGTGYGDFVIPASINSGNYKLIAYTNWMRNHGIDDFFKSDISIINPFQSNQEAILADKGINQPKNAGGLLDLNSDKDTLNTLSSPFLEIKANQKIFQKRAKATLTLKIKDNKNVSGNYSISVRKVDALDRLVNNPLKANTYKNRIPNKKTTINSINYLPELRGELISGRILKASNNLPAADEKISISIQQNDFIFEVSNTDENGVFYFNIDSDYNSENAFFQVLDKNNKDYVIEIDRPNSINYSSLDFGNFTISSSYKDDLEQRSTYNQIENGYFSLKSNTLKQIDTIEPFFGDYFTTFYLDDYTRFTKIQETFVEVIKDAFIKRDNNKKFNFFVTSLDPYERLEKPAGVIVDGVFLQNFEELIEYDSRKIKRISIARTETNFIFGSKIFGGFIVLETFNGDFFKELPKESITMFKLFKSQPKKRYFKKDYKNGVTTNRIPDFRSQLLWEPNIKMNGKEMIVNFFTSDNLGEYEINIEGFTANGDQVSIRSFITVENN